MNLKQIKYKYRTIFQISIFLIYVMAFFGILIWNTHNITRSHRLTEELYKWESAFTSNHISYKNIQVYLPAGDPLYTTGENDHTRKFMDNLSLLTDSLDILLRSAGKKIKEDLAIDSLQKSISIYQSLFRQSVSALRELSSPGSGKIPGLINRSKEIMILTGETSDPELMTAASEICHLLAEYLEAPGIVKYNALQYSLDGLSAQPSLNSDEMIVSGNLTESIQKFKTELEELDNAQKRLHSGGSSALNESMESTFFNITGQIIEIRSVLQEKLIRKTNIFIILSIIIMVVLAIIYVVQFTSFARIITGSLHNSILFSHNLSKGKIVDNQLETDVPYEISQLNQNLNKLAESVKDKKLFIESLLKQKFEVDLQLLGKNDSFGKTLIALKENMRKAREEQNKYAEENKARRYMNEGIAKFSDILRNNSNNLDNLADIFIRELVKYLEAIQGGMFLLNGDDENLTLKAAFAYNRKKYITKTIRKGESLVGTCAIEKKTIQLNDIPEEYIEITSGLGDAPPRNLLILPALHEGQLLGVVEIASLHSFNADQVSLSEKVVTNLASTIIAARINSKTAELLQKSQQQAAEMTEQEEEMRQNMEELKATQEESARREEELEGLLNAIGQSFYLLEYDIEGVIIKANQRFLDLVEMNTDGVVGMKHNQIFGKNSKVTQALFAKVSQGIPVELSEKVIVNKKHLKVRNTFTPVLSKDGKTLRILNIMLAEG